MISTGAGEKAGMVSMSTKYVAGWVSVNWTVRSSLATRPDTSVSSMYFSIAEGVPLTLAKPLQKSSNPAIRVW
jgi:hypothetical protein